MRKKLQRLSSRAARWSPRLGWFALIVLIVGILAHRFGLIATEDFLILVGISCVTAISAFALAIKGLADLWERGDKGGRSSLKGAGLALLTLAPLCVVTAAWFYLPPLNDISTDVDNPPPFLTGIRPVDAQPVRFDLSNQGEEQAAAWPQLSGRRYDGSPDRILTAVLAVLDTLGWERVGQKGVSGEDNELIVAATAYTFFLGFTSDIVIRLTDEGDSTFVDIRAASRYLMRDFGSDAGFAMEFMDALDTEVLLTPIDQMQD